MYFGYGTEPFTIITKYYKKLVTMVTKCRNIRYHGNKILTWLQWKRNTEQSNMVTKYGIHYHGYTYGDTFRQLCRVSVELTVTRFGNLVETVTLTGTRFDNLVELVLHLR